jgi:hypothetical protein
MEQDRWYAVETMIKANSVSLGVGNADGEMALWIDGVLVARHTGMLWRHDDELLLNRFIVWNYFPEATRSYRIWFDNLVIDTSPIGVFAGVVFEDDFESGDTEAWSEARGNPSRSDRSSSTSSCGVSTAWRHLPLCARGARASW